MPKRFRDEAASYAEHGRPRKRSRPDKKDRLSSLSDELLLRTLSFLSTPDLLLCERLSRRLKRLASDGQLWKALYYDRFVRPRASRIPGIKQQKGSDESLYYSSRRSKWLNDDKLVKDGSSTNWKRQYRLRHNWTRGSARITETKVAEQPSIPSLLVRLHSNLIMIADSTHGLRAWALGGQGRLIATQALRTALNDKSQGPTSMAIDTAHSPQGTTDVAIGFGDGGFSLYSLKTKERIFVHRYTHPASSNGSLSAIAYSFPHLVTLNQEPRLSLYTLYGDRTSDEDNTLDPPKLLSSMRSHTTYSPLCLNLRTSASSITASIAYAMPSFITGWSVGVQELRLAYDGSVLDSRVASAAIRNPMKAKSTLSTIARDQLLNVIPIPSSRPTSISYNHPYLLTAHPNNTLTLYVVTSTKDVLTISPGTVLWGHTSSISGAHVGDRGKAVSVSSKGNELRVWELEGRGPLNNARKRPPTEQYSVQVRSSMDNVGEAGPIRAFEAKLDETSKGWIAFDEEKVVLLREKMHGAQAVVVYDFT